ncbi:MAG TPA: hypothetical protein VIJ76_04635, partial [Galbitalea sp.]
RGAGIPDPTADPIVAATHFGVLATLSMGVLGAMHQFTPVITGRPLRSIRLARATFLSWLAASWMLPVGIATEQVAVAAISGAFAALAITLLVVNFIGPLSVRGKGAPVTGLRFALAGSVLTACLGAAFVGDRQGTWFALAGHVDLTMGVIGLFGWLGITYIAVAEKLWPMFFLAHVPGRHLSGRIAVWAVPVGVALLSAGLLFGLPGLAWSGAIVLAVGLGGHLASLSSYVHHRRRKADLHLLFVVTSALWLLVGAGLSLASALVMPHDYVYGMALVAAATVAFGGWLLTAFVGHAHKVVPFIVWSALRGRGVEKHSSGRPLLFADLYDHRWAAATYGLVTTGIIGLCIGFAASLPTAIAIGSGALAATGIIVGANLSVIPIRMLSDGGLAEAPRNDASRRVQVPVPPSSLGSLKSTLPSRFKNAER